MRTGRRPARAAATNQRLQAGSQNPHGGRRLLVIGRGDQVAGARQRVHPRPIAPQRCRGLATLNGLIVIWLHPPDVTQARVLDLEFANMMVPRITVRRGLPVRGLR